MLSWWKSTRQLCTWSFQSEHRKLKSCRAGLGRDGWGHTRCYFPLTKLESKFVNVWAELGTQSPVAGGWLPRRRQTDTESRQQTSTRHPSSVSTLRDFSNFHQCVQCRHLFLTKIFRKILSLRLKPVKCFFFFLNIQPKFWQFWLFQISRPQKAYRVTKRMLKHMKI